MADKKAAATLKKQKVSNKIDKETATKMKDKIKEWKRKHASKKLEEGIEKAGYSSRSLDEVKSGSKIGSIDTAGRIRQGIKKGGRAGFQHGGRTNLLEELGRVEAEPSNRNRRAEISRVHGELNRGYKKGGRSGYGSGGAVLKGKKVGIQIK